MADESGKQYAAHLEFLGYECEPQSDGWFYAKHPVRWNFFLKPFDFGVRFHCTIYLGLLSDAKRNASLQFLNRVNQQTSMARFTLDHEPPVDSFLVRARALAPARYRRQEFGWWMDMWHRDLELLRDAPWLEEGEPEEEETEQSRADTTVN